MGLYNKVGKVGMFKDYCDRMKNFLFLAVHFG